MARRLFLIRSFSKFKQKPCTLTLLVILIYIAELSLGLDVSHNPQLVRFYLYPSPTDPNKKVELSIEGDMLRNGPTDCNCGSQGWRSFKQGRLALLMIHDFGLNGDSYEAQSLKDAHLKSNIDGNYIIVDWGDLATPQGNNEIADTKNDYQKAVDNVPAVGDRIGMFMNNMVKNGFVSYALVHVMGHGLGAHVAGKAGDTFKMLCGGIPIWRITGLDPSAPLFGISQPARKLNRGDAYFVDTIHTDGGFQGDLSVHGDADFYVNGGLHQPGCDDVNTLGLCSHNFATLIYIASIQKPFIGCNCPPLLEDQQLAACLEDCPQPSYLGPYVLIPTTTGPYTVIANNPP